MDRIPKLCVRLVKGTAKETEDAIWCITEFAGHLVSGHSTGSIIWWNTTNTSISKKRRRDHGTELKIVRKIDRAHSDVVRTLSVCNLESTNTSFLVSGSWDKSIKLWNAEGLLAAQVSQAHQDWIYCTCDIFDNMFVSGSANGSVRFWKINIEKEEISISAGDSLDCGSEAMCMTLYEWNNKRILGIGTRNVVVLHDATSRFRELRTLEGHTGPVLCLTQWRYFLASGSEDRTVHIWSIDGEVLQILKCSIEWVTSIAVWRGNLCAGYRDWKVRCWSWDDYGKSLDAFIVRDEERIKLKTAYPIFVTSCDVELTGQTLSIKTLCVWKNYLCSASLDGSLRVWRVVLPWEIERLIWIGWHKNSDEENCLLAKLPKELVEHVIRFLK